MEQTPFDSDAPVGMPSQTPQIGANLPPSRPLQKPKKWLPLVPLALLLLAGIGGGAVWVQKQNEIRAREEKLAALRQDIKKIVLQDNALVLEMLDDGALDHITYAEFFKRADNNKEERDVLIRNLRATETGPYGEQVGQFVKLMETENEWVRAEEAVSRANLAASGKWDAYKDATGQTEEVSAAVSAARRDYEAAPYGEDYAETAALNSARLRLDSASESAKTAFVEWKDANDDAKAKKSSAAVVVADWMRNEPIWYPNFAPKRTVLPLLVKKKSDYLGGDAGEVAPKKAAATRPSDATETSTAGTSTAEAAGGTTSSDPVEPKPSPTPSAPTRVRSLEPLEGERFSLTRTDDIDADFAAQLSDEDLRYAVNEMYARFGMTFKDKQLQAQFEGNSWYLPDERWKTGAIERAMTPRERKNLRILSDERAARLSREE